MTSRTDVGDEFEGAIISLFHSLYKRPDKIAAL